MTNEFVVRGGQRCSRVEIEAVLNTFPAVAEAAVVGIEHPIHGLEIGAAVVLRAGHQFDPVELIAFCKDRLGPLKFPRVVWRVGVLPKTEMGHIAREQIEIPTRFSLPVWLNGSQGRK